MFGSVSIKSLSVHTVIADFSEPSIMDLFSSCIASLCANTHVCKPVRKSRDLLS